MWPRNQRETVTAISICLIGLVLLVTPARAGDAKAEIDFVTRASIGNLFAISESQLAVDRTDNPEVKGFAQQLVADHEKAKAALAGAAPGFGAQAAATVARGHTAG